MSLCIECAKRIVVHAKVGLCLSCYETKRLETLPNYGNCIRCKKRPAKHIKRQLCNPCYVYLRTHDELKSAPMLKKSTSNNDHYGREMDFIKSFFTHPKWHHQPATFKINGGNYTPDFYDGERNVFIEVSGSRQAYHINKDKYQLFRELFPLISFEIRKPNGLLLDESEDRLNWE